MTREQKSGTDDRAAMAVDLLQSLVQTPSVSGDEEAACDLLLHRLKGLGLATRRIGRNVLAESGPADAPALWLLSHLDTVPEAPGWTRDPYAAAMEGQGTDARIYGLGANDATASVVSMALGARRFLDGMSAGSGLIRGQTEWRLVLAFVCEEERGRPEGLAKVLAEVAAPTVALVGEPTGLCTVVAQRGLVVLEGHAKGRAAHAARPGLGRNAIYRAADAIVRIRDLVKFDREHPVLGRSSLQVTVINGGDRSNVVPASCDVVMDVRTTPLDTPAEVVAKVREAVGADMEITVRSERLRAVDIDPAHPLARVSLETSSLARSELGEAAPGHGVGSPTVSDWALLPREVAAVKVGPGESERSHTADEFVKVSELLAGVKFYEQFLSRWFRADEDEGERKTADRPLEEVP